MTPNSKSYGKRIEQVNKIFLKFSTFYGHIWRSQFKNEAYSSFARSEWSKALEKFDDKLIDQAIEECLKKCEMPPALAQFIDCCKRLSARKESFSPKRVYETCNPVVAQSNLKKIKAILNMK
ncbi:Vir protein [Legionella pneumophila]|nr:Vir protein [Legionella pneumophila]